MFNQDHDLIGNGQSCESGIKQYRTFKLKLANYWNSFLVNQAGVDQVVKHGNFMPLQPYAK